MTEIRTLNWTNNAIFDAAMRNGGDRAMVAEIAKMVMFLMHGKTASAGGAGVMGGFELATVSGQMQVTVAPGWGWYYDTGNEAPASPFGAFKLDSMATLEIDPGHGSWARYDLISIQCESDTDTVTSVPFWQSAPQNIPIQRGSQPILTVTKGTAATFPTIPTTPAGHLVLGAIRVGANVPNLDGATIVDLRDMLSLSTRESTRPIRFRSRPNSSVADVAEFILAEVLRAGVADGSGSKLKWDRANDWPSFKRTTTAAGEETTADMFPMMIPGGRSWWRRVPFQGRDSVLDDAPVFAEFGSNTWLSRVNPLLGEGIYYLSVPIATERVLQVTAVDLRYRCHEYFNADVNTAEVSFYHLNGSNDGTLIGTIPLDLGTPHVAMQAPSVNVDVVLKADSTLMAVLKIELNTNGTPGQGKLVLQSVGVQFQEGRTS